jgi:hypothetical protein
LVFLNTESNRIKYICAFYLNFFVFLDVLFRIFDVTLQWRQNMCHVIYHEGKYCTFNKNIREKKNQTPVRGQDGKISDTRGKDFYWSPTRRASLETRNLSLGCLIFFRLALLPVLDPLYLITFYWSICTKIGKWAVMYRC